MITMSLKVLDALLPQHAAALAARGLDVQLLADMGVVSAQPSSGSREDWVAIPYLVGGKVHSHKYRTVAGAKKFFQDKGKRRVFYNHDCLADGRLEGHPLVVTEGEIDALSAMTAGVGHVVSFPDGAALPAEDDDADRGSAPKFRWLDAYERLLRPVKGIILATDADEPGVALMNDLANKLGRGRCRWVKYPDGCKDLNDVLVRHGPDEVRRCLDDAAEVKVEGFYRLWDMPPRAEPTPYDPGIPGLERHYKVRAGDFCVVTGVPGSGKSAFVTDLACRMAQAHGWRVTVGSWEAWPTTDFRRAVRTWFNGAPERQQSPDEQGRADLWMQEHFSFIAPPEGTDMTVEWVIDMCRTAVQRFESRLIILDPWNEMEHLPDPRESMANYVGFAIRRLKEFAKSYGVHLIVVAHPRKMPRGVDGKAAKPTLYDIADSAAWINKADIGIVVHRENDLDTFIEVQKVKFHDIIGTPGRLLTRFDQACNRYFPLANQEAV
jgi:twinkle protein